MVSAILKILAVLRGLLDLWNAYVNHQEAKRLKEEQERQLNREKALEDLKKATTEEEIFDAMERIVSSRP